MSLTVGRGAGGEAAPHDRVEGVRFGEIEPQICERNGIAPGRLKAFAEFPQLLAPRGGRRQPIEVWHSWTVPNRFRVILAGIPGLMTLATIS